MQYDEELDLAILSPYFKRAELAAPDGSFKLAKGFAQKLHELRYACKFPLIVNTKTHTRRGCRTYADIENLKAEGFPASDDSFHLIGNKKYGTDTCAVDVGCGDFVVRGILVKKALDLGWNVRIAKTYVHLDRRSDYTNLNSGLDVY